MKNSIFALFILTSFGMFAQQQISLENLNDFREGTGNWQVVGDITVDRNIDVHDEHPSEEATTTKKKRKKKKSKVEPPKSITFKPGVGILLNYGDPGNNAMLFTKWEHGDMILELEVMMPKGSNSGIYFQGRYEMQLLDSWGVKNPKYSDMGGIYKNWETDPSVIFRGVSPSSNAAKAPGLWQKFRVHFRAPRFNAAGEKIENAKFVSVDLNGVRIHSNVEVPFYTGGQISKQEASQGPLMIQGDHGTVAFRNISYQLLKDSSVDVSPLFYRTYKGEYKGLEDIDTASVAGSGKAKAIDIAVVDEEDEYGVEYSGKIEIQEADNYTLSVGYTGGVKLVVDGKTLFENNSATAQGTMEETIKLTPGDHAFKLTNIKTAGWRAPRLGLTIKGTSSNAKSFHVYDSDPPQVNSVSPIFVDAEASPRLLRGFVAFEGDGQRLSHTIGVGTPQGVNFVYDLGAANLVGVWRGDFVDATPMWNRRGDGSFRGRGAIQWTFLNQSIAALESANSPFPKTGEAPDFVAKGYSMDQETGLPIFKHIYKGVEIENKIQTDKSNTYLIRSIGFSKSGLTNWYFKLASGKVKKMADGAYAIGDQQYYIKILSGQQAVVREVEGETELVLPVDGSKINYEIIW